MDPVTITVSSTSKDFRRGLCWRVVESNLSDEEIEFMQEKWKKIVKDGIRNFILRFADDGMTSIEMFISEKGQIFFIDGECSIQLESEVSLNLGVTLKQSALVAFAEILKMYVEELGITVDSLENFIITHLMDDAKKTIKGISMMIEWCSTPKGALLPRTLIPKKWLQIPEKN